MAEVQCFCMVSEHLGLLKVLGMVRVYRHRHGLFGTLRARGKLLYFLMRLRAIFERQMINLDTFYKADMCLSIFCRKR